MNRIIKKDAEWNKTTQNKCKEIGENKWTKIGIKEVKAFIYSEINLKSPNMIKYIIFGAITVYLYTNM